MKHLRWFIFVVLLAAQIGWLLPVQAKPADTSSVFSTLAADTDATKCWPLDVVVVIDQSPSMYYGIQNANGEFIPPSNDPDGYRFIAAKEVLDQLMRNRISECPRAVHRFGVIWFADKPEVILPLVQVDLNDTDDPQKWAEQYFQAIDNAANNRDRQDINKRLGEGTDPSEAFDLAQSLFEKAPFVNEAEGYGSRRKVVVLVSDGNPDSKDFASDASKAQYWCEFKEQLNADSWLDTAIWVLPLKGAVSYLDEATGCDGNTIRKDLQEITFGRNPEHRGQIAEFAYNTQTIPSFANRLVQNEFGKVGQPIACGTPFYVNPYQSSAKMVFFRDRKESLLVTLNYYGNDPNGEVLYQIRGGAEITTNLTEPFDQMEKTDYILTDYKEEYQFSQPAAGVWKFDVDGLGTAECALKIDATQYSDVSAIVLKPENTLPMAVVPESPYYDSTAQTFFTLQLQSKRNVFLPYLPDYPLDVKVKLYAPSDTDMTSELMNVPLTYQEQNGISVWTNESAPILAPEIGQYKVKILVTAPSAEPQKPDFVLFEGEQISFTAREIKRFDFKIIAPQSNDDLWCNRLENEQLVVEPLLIQVQLTEADGKTPAQADRYLVSDLNESFEIEVTDLKGNSFGKTSLVPLDAKNGLFQATFFNDSKEVRACDEIQMTVGFTGKTDPNQFAIAKTDTTSQITRKRLNGVSTVVIKQPPQQNLIHPEFCSSKILPVAVELMLQNSDGNRLDPADIATGDVADLYRLRLTTPDSTIYQDLKFERQERADGFVLFASGGITTTLAGKYAFEIVPVAAAFKEAYQPLSSKSIQVPFERNDTFVTSPTTCCGIKISGAALLAIVIAGIVWLMTGGPGGTLIFESTQEGIPVPSSISLSTRRFQTIRRKDLENVGIGSIAVRSTSQQYGSSAKGVRLEVKDTGGNAIFDSDVYDEPDNDFATPLTQEINVRYTC